jgi:hypothetical protein
MKLRSFEDGIFTPKAVKTSNLKSKNVSYLIITRAAAA